MRAGDPLNAMATALNEALHHDLPPIRWTGRDGNERERRPHLDDIEVYQFPQTWGDTSLGFGGVAGQALTTADTTVVVCAPVAVVYFGGRKAYTVKCDARFMEDVRAHDMAEVSTARGRYARPTPEGDGR